MEAKETNRSRVSFIACANMYNYTEIQEPYSITLLTDTLYIE